MKLPNALITLLIAGMTILSCKKGHPQDNNGLPPITQNGSNIVACKIDGNNWVIEDGDSNTGSFIGLFYNDTLTFGGFPKPTVYSLLIQSISFHIDKNPRQGMTYSLDDTTASFATYLTDSTCANFSIRDGTYLLSSGGSLSITKLDTLNHIYSGVFNCVFPVPGCDTIKITDGQFDVHYY